MKHREIRPVATPCYSITVSSTVVITTRHHLFNLTREAGSPGVPIFTHCGGSKNQVNIWMTIPWHVTRYLAGGWTHLKRFMSHSLMASVGRFSRYAPPARIHSEAPLANTGMWGRRLKRVAPLPKRFACGASHVERTRAA